MSAHNDLQADVARRIAMSDDERVERVYELVLRLDDNEAGPLLSILGEIFERHMPTAEWRSLHPLYEDLSPAECTEELESAREMNAERAYARSIDSLSVADHA